MRESCLFFLRDGEFLNDEILVGINACLSRDLHGFFGNPARRQLGVVDERPGRG
jgi:hypothetical protein